MKCSLGISSFLEEISSLPILLFPSISLHCSFKKAFLLFFAVFWNSIQLGISFTFSLAISLLFFSQLFVNLFRQPSASSDNHVAFLHYSLFGLVLVITYCCSVAQSCPTLCDPVNCSMPGFPILHNLLEFAQTHVHWVNDAIPPSSSLSSPAPPAFNLSQHQGLFQWVGSLHQVAKVLEFQLQHQSSQ